MSPGGATEEGLAEGAGVVRGVFWADWVSCPRQPPDKALWVLCALASRRLPGGSVSLPGAEEAAGPSLAHVALLSTLC